METPIGLSVGLCRGRGTGHTQG